MTLIIQRPVQWYAMFRAVRLMLDGANAGTVGPGQTVAIKGNGDRQTLRAKVDWTHSEKLEVIDLDESETRIVVRFPPLWKEIIKTLVQPGTLIELEIEFEGEYRTHFEG